MRLEARGGSAHELGRTDEGVVRIPTSRASGRRRGDQGRDQGLVGVDVVGEGLGFIGDDFGVVRDDDSDVGAALG